MKTTVASVALALPALAAANQCKPYVTSEDLQGHVELDDLKSAARKLQSIADDNGGERSFGSAGHNSTVDWIVETLEALDYFDVVKQPFSEIFSQGTSSLSVNGETVESSIMTYTPGGASDGPLVAIDGLGCEVSDFPSSVEGRVAFVSRGECAFGDKSLNAKSAGAAAIIIYNNEPGMLSGTLGEPLKEYAPTVAISQEDAQPILAALEAGEVTVDLDVDAVTESRVNYNVLATTKGGDQDNVVVAGAHSDSVPAGAGINDDGSGVIGLLNVAAGLANYRVKNAVRLGFWGAEEFGKLGSYYYIESINGSMPELQKIRAYLNFDMIASPNYMLGIYDGDGSAFGLTGPPGSDVIEADFEQFYESKNEGHVPTEFSGRSDYAAFIENGIPSGGLFTGAEVLKTEAEVELFGGEAGVAYDVNYHQAGDTIENLDWHAFVLNTKSIANSVAKYALSFDSLPNVDMEQRRWDGEKAKVLKRNSKKHPHPGHSGPCGGGARI